MPKIEFTSHLTQHVACPAESVEAQTLGQALELVFASNPQARGYILNDQGTVRPHIAIFIDNQLLSDRENLDVPLAPDSQVFVMQALSGG